MISSQAYAKSKLRLKFATLAPKTVGWALKIQNIFIPAFKEATDNKISIKWYWGGIKGDDIDYIKLMKKGELDGAAYAGNGVMQICPEMSALSLPFLFNNYEEVDYVRTQMSDRFKKILKSRNFRLLFWADQDFDQIYSSSKIIKSLEDFKEITFVGGYNNPIEKYLVQKLKAKLIPVRSLNSSSIIRQKKANAYIGPALWVIGRQLYTSFRYVTPINIRYSPAALIMTQKSWKKIPSKYHKKISNVLFENGMIFCKQNRIDTQRALLAMKKYGLKVMNIEPEEKKALEKKCKSVWAETNGKVYPKKILNEIKNHLKKFRN